MRRNPLHDEDRASVREFFRHWGDLVRDVDFKRARELYTEDVIAFGSLGKMMNSRAALEAEQWRAVWPTVEDYRHDLDTLEIIVSPDRLMAMGATFLLSTGIGRDGTKFERVGRVTATLMRAALAAPWLITHSHVSLVPGTPAPSFGKRPEKA
jgi:ketosteroid isomerase-like protein